MIADDLTFVAVILFLGGLVALSARNDKFEQRIGIVSLVIALALGAGIAVSKVSAKSSVQAGRVEK